MFKAKGIMLVSTENKEAKNRDDTQNFTFIQCGHESDGTYVFNVQCWNYHRAYMFMFKKKTKQEFILVSL